jgi:hypothetical protein
MSYEALIAAQAKRLTKKRERMVTRYEPDASWLNNWRDDCQNAQIWRPAVGSVPESTYADLYVPPAPERVELSHTEWADGYRKWRAEHALTMETVVRFYTPCFAENEI